MSDIPNFKVDIWWKAVLILGVTSCIGAVSFKVNFIERKHLFGLGLGMVLIGVGYWKSWKVFSQIRPGGILSIPDYKHDFVSVSLIVIGILLLVIFGFLLVKGLI
jgi:hypothetical protein